MLVWGRIPDESVDSMLSSSPRFTVSEMFFCLVGVVTFLVALLDMFFRFSPPVVFLVMFVVSFFCFVIFFASRSGRGSEYNSFSVSIVESNENFHRIEAKCLYGEALEQYVGRNISRFSRTKRGDYAYVRTVQDYRRSRGGIDWHIVYTVLMRFPLCNGRFGYLLYDVDTQKLENSEKVQHPERISFDVLYALDEKGDVCCLIYNLDNTWSVSEVYGDYLVATNDV